MPRLIALLLLLALFSCSAPQPAPAPDAHSAAWLQGQLAELQTMSCPEGCAATSWQQLKDSLAATIEARLAGKQASAPPTAPSARPLVQLDPSGPYLTWYFVNPGDYNQDGVVTVSDLTPLGASLGDFIFPGYFGFQTAESVVDGDSNGEINISDLTPLGANLGNSITEWRLYEAADLSAYPAAATDASTLAPLLVRPLADTIQGPPSNRRQYVIGSAPDPAKWYWVRGADASGEGIASAPVGGNNLPPNASLVASGVSGTPPFSLHLDASASTDPEGQDLQFVWFIEGSGIYAGPVIDPEFNIEGLFPAAVYVIDEMGANDIAVVTVTSSLGEQWRVSEPDSTHVLDFTDRIRLTQLQSPNVAEPALAFTSKEGTDDAVIFIGSEDVAGLTWSTPTVVATLDGLLAEVDSDLVDGAPALCWLSRPTGSPTDTLNSAQADTWFGSGWTTKSVTQTIGLRELALAPAGTDVVIAYHDGDAASLQSAQGRADDVGLWDITPIDNSGTGGRTPTIEIIDGSPAVAYWYPFTNTFRYADSFTTPGGDVIFNAPVTVGAASGGLGSSLVRLPDGSPAFSYYIDVTGLLWYQRAVDQSGDIFAGPAVVDGTAVGDGRCLPAMCMVRGRPFMAYVDPPTGTLLAAYADDVDGTSWDITTVSSDLELNVYPDVAQISGKPAVAYAAADGTPRFAIFY